MPASARTKRWLGWFFLGLFWLIQIATVLWFVSYQMILGRPFPTGDLNFVRTVLVWLLATILSGALVVLTPPPDGISGRRRRVR